MEEPRTRVLRHESDVGSWQLVVRRPEPRLARFVGEYGGYVESGAPNTVLRQEVPSIRVPVIINLGSSWRVADAVEVGREQVYDSFAAGLAETSAFVAATGPACCLEVDFTPLGAHMFLGIPMHEIANRVIDLHDLKVTRSLAERIADAPTWEGRFSILDAALTARLARARPPSPEVTWAWRALEQSHGRVQIGALAERLGRSRRHLIARFREQVGLPPKTVARIFRFQHAVELIQSRGYTRGFAALAQDCGYFDQAHLIRDFREFAGTTPGEFARRVLPDGGGVLGA